MTTIETLRKKYHEQICTQIVYPKSGNIPSMADVRNKLSISISKNLINYLPYRRKQKSIAGQTAGRTFEQITRDFLEDAFKQLEHLRPGQWRFSLKYKISDFEQYQHLSELDKLMKKNRTLKAALGGYYIHPDIIVGRYPVTDEEINKEQNIVDSRDYPKYSPLRAINNPALILHASISCKWTIRSDRAQNSRTEGLDLIRNRKGNTPHVVVITAEPTPSRIASLALGTGDIDCVYYFALPELEKAIEDTKDLGAQDLLGVMIEGRRLRDIADLPFDLAI